MPLAVIEFSDFLLVVLFVVIMAGGTAASAQLRSIRSSGIADRLRVARLEQKVDLILTHLGLEYTSPPKSPWQELADDPRQKIAAIKAYREQYGGGLAEAKRAVEEYMQGGGR